LRPRSSKPKRPRFRPPWRGDHACGRIRSATDEIGARSRELAAGRMVARFESSTAVRNARRLSERNLANSFFFCAGPMMKMAPASAIAFVTSSKYLRSSATLCPARFTRDRRRSTRSSQSRFQGLRAIWQGFLLFTFRPRSAPSHPNPQTCRRCPTLARSPARAPRDDPDDQST
jgi:hypothetical protein